MGQEGAIAQIRSPFLLLLPVVDPATTSQRPGASAIEQ
jgi:hypothetical protein